MNDHHSVHTVGSQSGDLTLTGSIAIATAGAMDTEATWMANPETSSTDCQGLRQIRTQPQPRHRGQSSAATKLANDAGDNICGRIRNTRRLAVDVSGRRRAHKPRDFTPDTHRRGRARTQRKEPAYAS